MASIGLTISKHQLSQLFLNRKNQRRKKLRCIRKTNSLISKHERIFFRIISLAIEFYKIETIIQIVRCNKRT